MHGVVRQPSQLFSFHFQAGATPRLWNGDFQVNARAAAGQVPNPMKFTIVKRAIPTTTGFTACPPPLDARMGECGPSHPQALWSKAETPSRDVRPLVVNMSADDTSANFFQIENAGFSYPEPIIRHTIRLFYPLNITKTHQEN